MEIKVIQKIKNNTKCLMLLKHGEWYEVSIKDGIDFNQYWKFKTLVEALDKLNKLSEGF